MTQNVLLLSVAAIIVPAEMSVACKRCTRNERATTLLVVVVNDIDYNNSHFILFDYFQVGALTSSQLWRASALLLSTLGIVWLAYFMSKLVSFAPH